MQKQHVIPVVAIAAITLAIVYLFPGSTVLDDPAVSHQKRSSVRTADIRDRNEVTLPEFVRELLEDLQKDDTKPGTHDFSFRFTQVIRGVATDIPLSGVRVELHSFDKSSKTYVATSSALGRAQFRGLPLARYGVKAVHDFYVPAVHSSYHRKLVVVVPGVEATCGWVEAYAYGVKIVGNKHPIEHARTRMDVSRRQASYFRGPAMTHLFAKLRAKWGAMMMVMVPSRLDNLTQGVTIFDRDKGPCRFEVPIVPLRDFTGPTVCDISKMPVVEPMASLTINVSDAAGMPVDVGRFAITRDVRYHDFQSDRLASNTEHYIPPGVYTLSTPTWLPWYFKRTRLKGLRSGEKRKITYKIPVVLRDVEFRLPRDASVQVMNPKKDNHYSPSFKMHDGDRLLLPEGENTLLFLFADGEGHREVRKKVTVRPTLTVQRVTIPGF